MRQHIAGWMVFLCLGVGAGSAVAQDVNEDGTPDLLLSSAMTITFAEEAKFRFENRSDEDGYIDALHIVKKGEKPRVLPYTEEEGHVDAGERFDFSWDRKNAAGQPAAPGLYSLQLLWISLRTDMIYTLKRDFELEALPKTGQKIQLIASKSHYAPGETVQIKLLTLNSSPITIRGAWTVGFELSNDSERVHSDSSLDGTVLGRRQERLLEWRPVDAQGRPLKAGQYGITLQYSLSTRTGPRNAAKFETIRILNW